MVAPHIERTIVDVLLLVWTRRLVLLFLMRYNQSGSECGPRLFVIVSSREKVRVLGVGYGLVFGPGRAVGARCPVV